MSFPWDDTKPSFRPERRVFYHGGETNMVGTATARSDARGSGFTNGDAIYVRAKAKVHISEGPTCPWDAASDAAEKQKWLNGRKNFQVAAAHNSDSMYGLLVNHAGSDKAGHTEALQEMEAGHTGRRPPIGVPHLLERLAKPTCPWTKQKTFSRAHYEHNAHDDQVAHIAAETAAGALAAALHAKFATMQEAFLEVDDDRNGKISPAELRRMMRLFNLETSKLGDLIAEMDKDESGDLDFAEFATLVRSWFGELAAVPVLVAGAKSHTAHAAYERATGRGGVKKAERPLPPPPPFAREGDGLPDHKPKLKPKHRHTADDESSSLWTPEHDGSTNISNAKEMMAEGAAATDAEMAAARREVAKVREELKMKHHHASRPLW